MSKQDWKDYENYLVGEINSTEQQKESIFRNHYIDNMYRDLKDVRNKIK